MIRLRHTLIGIALAAMLPAAAGAHSLETLQEQLFEKERSFQIKNDAAPEFTLQDASGEPVQLADYRGKIIVLYFIFAGCPDVCPLHAERIAQVQEMINVTPMRDQVAFITITTDSTRDTPDALSAYGQAHGLDAANWKFLTSGPDRPRIRPASSPNSTDIGSRRPMTAFRSTAWSRMSSTARACCERIFMASASSRQPLAVHQRAGERRRPASGAAACLNLGACRSMF